MKTFRTVLINSLAASLTNMFVWFAVTFWAYLQTKAVVVTSVMAGVYLGTVAISGMFLGSIVDHHPKRLALMGSSICSLVLYVVAALIYFWTPAESFKDPWNPMLWAFILLTLLGAIAGNLRNIAVTTLVTILVPEDERDKANGLVGSASGVAFLVCSLLSGLVIGFLGMWWMLVIAVAMTLVVIAHLMTISIPGDEVKSEDDAPKKVDLKGTIKAVGEVPGLFGLIFFSTFNNFLGGVYMSLMDAYGLSMMTVEIWGALWGFLSLGFIVGGLVVAKRGLGGQPVQTLFRANIVMWVLAMVMAIQPSIILLTVGLFVYLCLIPAVEAAEQTIVQQVIPVERQGRVFGFAQSVEQAASPITAFVIGPIAQFVFIPFMTTGSGADLIGNWFGTGPARGLALLFTVTGVVGLLVTLFAMRTYSYRMLTETYRKLKSQTPAPEAA
jgi:MFS transporter, DHA3 family, multidrug efflux protein